APARELVDPIHFVLEAQPAERLHERYAFAIAIGDARAKIDVRLLSGLLPDPAVGIRDQAALVVVLAGRKRPHGLHERGIPFAAAGFFVRAVKRFELDRKGLPPRVAERMLPARETAAGDLLLLVER